LTLYCPVAHDKVFYKTDWIKQKVSETFEANFWIIGESILYSRPKGYTDFEGVKKSLALNDEVAAYVASGKNPYIQIEDYSFLNGSNAKARRYFINKINEDNRRLSIIFCNTTLPVNIAIKIGKQFNTTNKYVHVEKNYKDTILHAKTMMGFKEPKLNSSICDILKPYTLNSNSLSPVEIVTKKEWEIDTPEFSNHPMVINNSILHSTTEGFLRSQDIPFIDQVRYQCQSSLPDNSKLQYIIIDCEKLKGSTHSARIKMMQSLKVWTEKYSLRMYIPYNTNLLAKTAFLMAKPIMPFKIKIAQDLGHALRMVQADQEKELQTNRKQKTIKVREINEKDIESLLSLIGNLNWEVEGFKEPINIPHEHPFFYLYQSVRLIKEELDDLLAERKLLESQLQQSQKMESIGRLAGGIAHDFNNILYMILGNTELGLEEVTEDHPVNNTLLEIKSASLRGAGIVRQLLNFSRKSNLEIKPVNAVKIITDSIDFIRFSIPSSIEIDQKLDGQNITILADPVQINQIIMNICTNAFQAMEKDDGKITIETKPIELQHEHIRYNPDLKKGLYYEITITDTGPGINPENIDKIFDPYFTTKEIGKGSGMGLAIVHGIIKNHKGIITVDRDRRRGTRFTILIPQANTKPEKEFTFPSQKQQGSERILFVDDEKALAEMSYKTLTRLGYKVETYLDPEKALNEFKSNPDRFDLVITDMTMPKKTGVQLAESLKKIRPDIPVIICSGNSPAIDESKAKQLGVDAFIQKPVTMAEVGKSIREALAQSKDNQ